MSTFIEILVRFYAFLIPISVRIKKEANEFDVLLSNIYFGVTGIRRIDATYSKVKMADSTKFQSKLRNIIENEICEVS